MATTRKFEITPEVCKKAYEYASHGLTEAQIAQSLGIHPSTLRKKKNEYEAFDSAIKAGQAEGIQVVANCLFEAITKKGNVAAAIFYLKNRANWKDGETQIVVQNNVTKVQQVKDARREIREALKAA